MNSSQIHCKCLHGICTTASPPSFVLSARAVSYLDSLTSLLEEISTDLVIRSEKTRYRRRNSTQQVQGTPFAQTDRVRTLFIIIGTILSVQSVTATGLIGYQTPLDVDTLTAVKSERKSSSERERERTVYFCNVLDLSVSMSPCHERWSAAPPKEKR